MKREENEWMKKEKRERRKVRKERKSKENKKWERGKEKRNRKYEGYKIEKEKKMKRVRKWERKTKDIIYIEKIRKLIGSLIKRIVRKQKEWWGRILWRNEIIEWGMGEREWLGGERRARKLKRVVPSWERNEERY